MVPFSFQRDEPDGVLTGFTGCFFPNPVHPVYPVRKTHADTIRLFRGRRFIEITWGLFRFPEYVDNMSDKDQKFTKPKYGPLPIMGLPVQVQCVGFKCMAFRDQAGRWVDLFTREFVPTVLGVVPGC
jgi:hypothetical protein